MTNKMELWNQRHQESVLNPAPCDALKKFSHLLPSHGDALDVACGLGRNAIFLSQNNLQTKAWDFSETAIIRLTQHAKANHLEIEATVRDLAPASFCNNSFDVIVVSYFLDRSLASAIVNALKPKGLLFYQTFTAQKVASKNHTPKSKPFLLKPNELLSLFCDLQTLAYQELMDSGDINLGLRNEAFLVAKKN